MKNITVTVDDALYRRVRLYAAEQGTTVTALVRDIITRYGEAEPDDARRLREEIELLAEIDARPERHVDEGFVGSARDDLYRGGGMPRRVAA